MKTFTENTTLQNFEAWSGAVDTKETILDNNKGEEFNDLIEDLYPEGLSETTLNDILWFEEEFLFNSLGIDVEE
tara:strand:+ start:138 stop:359 length:222 start_codon:yes stop_codon:yes gene_type:complete